MELVDGDDLSQRIARGALPPAEALPIAKQIAEALEAAHEQGIIHRDLKPANIKVRSDRTVKVLDFGLAKALDANASGATTNAVNSPTITAPAGTQAGTILGTAAYMSPEQARGQAVDRRTDIWAFGAVLFEMLTGTRAFPGDNITDTLAGVVGAEPDWRLLPRDLPGAIGGCLRRCLHKDPRQRMQAMGDVRIALEGGFETSAPQTAEFVSLAQSSWRRALPVMTLLAGAVASAVVAWSVWPTAEPGAVKRFVHSLPDGYANPSALGMVVALSPDGRSIAYNTPQGLYLRAMGELEGRLIPTEEGVGHPFFSPDGQSIGYFVGYELRRRSLSGGAPILVSRTTSNPLGATWTRDDTILFGQAEGVFRVSATGGTPELVIRASAGERIFGPHLLPDGDSVLVTVTTGTWDEGRIVVASLSTGERTVLVNGGSDARFVPTGHLIYALGDALLAVAFDPDRRTVAGRSVPIVQGLMRSGAGSLATGTANYDVAHDKRSSIWKGVPSCRAHSCGGTGRESRSRTRTCAVLDWCIPRCRLTARVWRMRRRPPGLATWRCGVSPSPAAQGRDWAAAIGRCGRRTDPPWRSIPGSTPTSSSSESRALDRETRSSRHPRTKTWVTGRATASICCSTAATTPPAGTSGIWSGPRLAAVGRLKRGRF